MENHSGVEELRGSRPGSVTDSLTNGTPESLEASLGGHPVPIIIQNEDEDGFRLDEEALGRVLLQPGIEDKHVCVLAVAGAFRKGKSFLLDFLLRYCRHMDSGSPTSSDWLGDPSEPLKGFKWRQGSKRETTGILIWSKPFVFTRSSGEKVAVILMDTQGTFDTKTSMKDNTIVFSLTMMVSSVLVYNLMNNIQEDDLMNLQTFTSYGRQAQQESDTSHAFQRLQILVRDWSFPYETPFGFEGGQRQLDEILEISPKQHLAHQDIRRDLRKCFRDIFCYLLPHPGDKVIRHAHFDGRLQDISEEFVEHLRILVPRLLAPDSLVKKEFGGQAIRARDLYQFFATFMEITADIDLPEPTTLVEFAAKASSQTAMEAAREGYEAAMDLLVGGDRPFLKSQALRDTHEREAERATQLYVERNKYGRNCERLVTEYKTLLEEELEKMFERYQEQNEAKNWFKAARTPSTLFVVLSVLYVLSGVFGLFWVYALAEICNWMMGVTILTIATWTYVRYSGEYRDVGVYIDETAALLYDNVLYPVYSLYMEGPLMDAAAQQAQQAVSSAIAGAARGGSSSGGRKSSERGRLGSSGGKGKGGD